MAVPIPQPIVPSPSSGGVDNGFYVWLQANHYATPGDPSVVADLPNLLSTYASLPPADHQSYMQVYASDPQYTHDLTAWQNVPGISGPAQNTPGAPGTPGGPPTVGTGPGGSMTTADLIKYLQGSVGAPALPAGASDDLAKSYLAYYGQLGGTAMQQAIALQQQDQQNALRQAELFGADQDNTPTDAAQRWRKELEAQQAVQSERLKQQQAELMGQTDTGQKTLAAQQLAQTAQESAAERALRLQMQQGEFGQQTAMQQGQQGWQTQERLGTQQFQAGESAAERALRLQLQSGQLNQQESEFARSYLLQQEESRRQQAQQSGFLDNGQLTEEARAQRAREALATGTAVGNIGGQQTEEQRAAMAREALQAGGLLGSYNGQQTEEQRAAMEKEREQRAQTAAGLTDNSKDVFKAANYFRNMQGGGGLAGALGLGNGVGFTTAAQRSQGVPGTIGYGDIDQATGDAASQQTMINSQYTGRDGDPSGGRGFVGPQQAGGMGGGFSMQQAPSGGGAMTGSAPGVTASAAQPQAWGDTSDERKNRERGVMAGTQPGGPVGGMGRLVSPEQHAAKMEAMRAQLNDPNVKKMFRQMSEHMRSDQGSPAGIRPSFGGAVEKDRRAVKGLALLHKRGGLPGSQPGGPVDAPMWPTDSGGSNMGAGSAPSVPDPSSVGAPPSAAASAPAPSSAPFAQADVPAMDAKLNAFREYLTRYGMQGLGAQALEAQNATDKGVMEGAFGALGLNPEDAMMAYAQSRFANGSAGNALMA